MGNENDPEGLKAKKHVRNFPRIYLKQQQDSEALKFNLDKNMCVGFFFLCFSLQTRHLNSLYAKKKKRERKIALSLFNEDMGLTWYCVFDGVGLWCIVGSGVLSGHSGILAALSSFQVPSLSPQSY